MKHSPNSFMGYNLFSGNLDNLSYSSKTVINTINQYAFCIAQNDRGFKQALMSSDVLLPDGIGIVTALKSVTGTEIKKIAGTDLHTNLIKRMGENNGRVFYLGASKSTLQKIANRLHTEYPGIVCETYSPPYRDHFGDAENAKIIDIINQFKPDVLFVGMSAPKQEKWVHEHKDKIDAKAICSVGAVFDFYAGTVKRPSQFWIDLGLEWFVRLCQEPTRLWKRYIYYGPIFAWTLMKEKLATDFRPMPAIKLSEEAR